MRLGGGRWAVREYVYGIVILSAAMSVIFALTPEGRGQGLKKHVRLISSICLLCVLIEPATELIDRLSAMGEDISGSISDSENGLYERYDSIYENYLDGKYGENIGQAVKDALYEKFGIKNENCRVSTEFHYSEKDSVKIPRKITAVLSGRAVYVDPIAVKDFISELFGCEAEVALE